MSEDDIAWLKSHGFRRDTKCREARIHADPPGEAWKRGFDIDSVNYHRLERRRYYCVVFRYRDIWLADFGRTARWGGGRQSRFPQEAIKFAFEQFIGWREYKIAELSDERIAAANLEKELLKIG